MTVDSLNNQNNSEEPEDFLTVLAQLEQEIFNLKQRYQEIEAAEKSRPELIKQQKYLQKQVKKYPELKQELTQIKEKLDDLEFTLESRLVNLFDPFWLAVRFGGLGIIIGWFLKLWINN